MDKRGYVILIVSIITVLVFSLTLITLFQRTSTQCETLLDYHPEMLLDREQSRQDIENWVGATYNIQPNEIESFVSNTRNDIAFIRWEKASYDYRIAFSISEFRVKNIQVSLPDGFFSTSITGEQLAKCLGEPQSYRFSYVTGEISGGIYQIWYPDKGIMVQGVQPRQETMNSTLDNNITFNQYTFSSPYSDASEMVLDILYGSPEDIIQSWTTTLKPWEN